MTTTTSTTTRIRVSSLTSCHNFISERKQLFCSSSSPENKAMNCRRGRLSVATTSLNVDSQRAAPLQTSAHQTTFIRRADGSTTVRLVVPSAGSASIKAQRAAGERSTKLLVGIVVVFLVCHVVRLVIQVRTSIMIWGSIS